MKIKVASIFGIPIFVHWSFLLLIAYGALVGWYYPISFWTGFWMILFAFALFLCVIIHELGHALMARNFGVPTIDIILSPIGGVARLDKLPEKPIQELMIALAGPLANVLISILLLPFYFLIEPSIRVNIWGWFSGDPNTFFLGNHYGQIFIAGLLMLNVVLAIFNLIPAFPMDGGRMLRAILTWPLGRLKATVWASIGAQSIAVFLLVYGIVASNTMLSLIGVFVFLTAYRERRLVRLEQKLKMVPVREIIGAKNLRWVLDTSLKEEEDFEGPKLLIDRWNNPKGIIKEKENIPLQRFLSPNISLEKALKELDKTHSNHQPIAVWEKGKVIAILSLKEIEMWLERN
jgi:Zn-dependent protease